MFQIGTARWSPEGLAAEESIQSADLPARPARLFHGVIARASGQFLTFNPFNEVLKMAIPTRFPGGLTTAAPDATLANLGQIDPTKFATFFDDLFIPAAALGTFTAIAGNGGLVTVATTKVIGTPAASFTPRASKRAFFKAKLSTSVVASVS